VVLPAAKTSLVAGLARYADTEVKGARAVS